MRAQNGGAKWGGAQTAFARTLPTLVAAHPCLRLSSWCAHLPSLLSCASLLFIITPPPPPFCVTCWLPAESEGQMRPLFPRVLFMLREEVHPHREVQVRYVREAHLFVRSGGTTQDQTQESRA